MIVSQAAGQPRQGDRDGALHWGFSVQHPGRSGEQSRPGGEGVPIGAAPSV